MGEAKPLGVLASRRNLLPQPRIASISRWRGLGFKDTPPNLELKGLRNGYLLEKGYGFKNFSVYAEDKWKIMGARPKCIRAHLTPSHCGGAHTLKLGCAIIHLARSFVIYRDKLVVASNGLQMVMPGNFGPRPQLVGQVANINRRTKGKENIK